LKEKSVLVEINIFSCGSQNRCQGKEHTYTTHSSETNNYII